MPVSIKQLKNSFLKNSTCHFNLFTEHLFIPHAFYMLLHILYYKWILSSCILYAISYFVLHRNSFLKHSMNNKILITAYNLSLNTFYMELYTFYCTEIHSSCIQHAILYSLLHINSFLRHSTCYFLPCTAQKFIPHALNMQLFTLYCT